MPRACQQRRDRTAVQKKSKQNPKPAGPPPIRHKTRQKAIHNARHPPARRRGGRPSRNQGSGTGTPNSTEQDFISFGSNGNNSHVRNGSGGRHDPISLDEDGSPEDGELITDHGSEEDESDDLDMYDAEDMMINVQVDQVYRGKGKTVAPQVMFPVMEAISIYRGLYQAGFPLFKARNDRYGIHEEESMIVVEPAQQPVVTAAPQPQQHINTTLSQYSRVTFKLDATAGGPPPRGLPGSRAPPNAPQGPASQSRQNNPKDTRRNDIPSAQGDLDPARDYVFDFGAYKGIKFNEAPENYLKTIGGNPYLLDKYPAAKDAFDYHRPGKRRLVPTEGQRADHERSQAASAATAAAKAAMAAAAGPSRNTRSKATKSWKDFKFPPKSAHAKKRLDQVDENYLRTIEGMAHVMDKWPGLKEALQDYNKEIGRRGRSAA